MLRAASAADAAVIAQLHIDSWRSAYRDILDPDYLAGPIEQERHEVWAGRFAEPNPAGGGESLSLRYAWRDAALLQASTKGDEPAVS